MDPGNSSHPHAHFSAAEVTRTSTSHARAASPAVANARQSQEETRGTSLDRHPTHHEYSSRRRVTSLHPFPSMASADVAHTNLESIAERRARTRARTTTSQAPPSRFRLNDNPRRHGTISRPRLTSLDAHVGRPRGVSVGANSTAEDTVDFSLAGTQNAPTVPQSYVDPGYPDLNPEYVQANSRPVWGIAGPLPRVLRPAMVPTRAEARQRAQSGAHAHRKQTDLQKVDTRKSYKSTRSHPSRSGREQGEAHQDSVDVERGHVPLTRLRQVSIQVGELRADREEQLLSRYALQRTSSRRSRTSTTGSVQERFYGLEHTISPLTPYMEIDEDEAGLGAELAPIATNGTRPDGTQDHAEGTVTTEDEITDAEEELAPEDEVRPSVPLPAYDATNEAIRNNHNMWSVIRSKYREELAEFLAVVVQLTSGFCADLSVSISGDTSGTTTPLAWGFSTMTAIYIAGGISGAHLNPAITIVLAIFRGFPARKVPGYIFVQILGAFVAALIAYGLYQPAIFAYAGSRTPTDATSQATTIVDAFITSLRKPYITWSTGFLNEFVATAFLVITVLALGDNTNAPPGAGMNALIVGFVVANICICFGFDTGAALNPSRDLGPRLALLALGFDVHDLFIDRAWWWIYGPWVACIVGALVGAFVYDVCIFTGGESPVNYSKPNVDRIVRRTKGKWEGVVEWKRASKERKGKKKAARNKEAALEEGF